MITPDEMYDAESIIRKEIDSAINQNAKIIQLLIDEHPHNRAAAAVIGMMIKQNQMLLHLKNQDAQMFSKHAY